MWQWESPLPRQQVIEEVLEPEILTSQATGHRGSVGARDSDLRAYSHAILKDSSWLLLISEYPEMIFINSENIY